MMIRRGSSAAGSQARWLRPSCALQYRTVLAAPTPTIRSPTQPTTASSDGRSPSPRCSNPLPHVRPTSGQAASFSKGAPAATATATSTADAAASPASLPARDPGLRAAAAAGDWIRHMQRDATTKRAHPTPPPPPPPPQRTSSDAPQSCRLPCPALSTSGAQDLSSEQERLAADIADYIESLSFHTLSSSEPSQRLPTSSTASPSSPSLPSRCSSSSVAKDEQQPQLLAVLSGLSPARRRFLLVAAASQEWYGPRQTDAELRAADHDHDQRINPTEYRTFVQKGHEARSGGLTTREVALVALSTAIPFVAFGCLDNAVMILSGDLIDKTIGGFFHLSAMATAGLGGVCSGTMGIQVHGLAERAVQALGFRPPPLSAAQRRHSSYRRATHIGGTAGICVGLAVGMFPLLFLSE